MRILLLSIITIVLLGCSKTTTLKVHHVKPNSQAQGVVYALPINIIQVDFKAVMVSKTKGSLSVGCLDLLEGSTGLNFTKEEISDKQEEIQNLGASGKKILIEFRDINISRLAYPDPLNLYAIDLTGHPLSKKEFTIVLNEKGLITSLDADLTDRSVDLAVEVLEIAAGIAGAFFLGVKQEAEACTVAEAKIARSVISRIKTIRASKDSAKNPALIQELEKQEKKLINRYFFINSDEYVWNATFKAEPNKESFNSTNIMEVPLFDIYQNGCVELSSNENSNLMLPKEFRLVCAQGNPGEKTSIIILQVKNINPELTDTISTGLGVSEVEGIRYRIPGNVQINLLERALVDQDDENIAEGDENILANSDTQISQLGVVKSLPAKLGFNQTKFNLEFHVDTGSLKSIGATGETIQAEQLEKIGEVTDTFTTGIKDKEINRLETKKKKLQLKKDIADLEEQLSKEEEQ